MRPGQSNKAFNQEVIKTCVCPLCYGVLKMADRYFECPKCAQNYPIIEGIPKFLAEGALSDKIRQLSQAYDRNSVRYHGSPKSCGYSSNKDYLTRLNVLKKWISIDRLEGKSILDVGCGTGLMSEQLVSENDVWGADISVGLLNIAKQKGLKTILSSADRLPFKNRHFDIVLCVGVIPYYRDPKGIFSEICRVTQLGGKMVVTSTTNSGLIRSVQFLKHVLGLSSQLAHLYTTGEIATFLKKEGAEVLDACMAYKKKLGSTREGQTDLRFRFFSRTSAVLATIPNIKI